MKLFSPYVVLKNGQPSTGADIELLNIVTKKLNLNEPEYKMIRGFTAVVNAVQNGEADIGFGGLSLTHERYQKAPYIFPVYQRTLYFSTIKLRTIDNFFTLYRPFQGWVWISIIICSFCLAMFFLILDFLFNETRNLSLFKALVNEWPLVIAQPI